MPLLNSHYGPLKISRVRRAADINSIFFAASPILKRGEKVETEGLVAV